MRGLPDEGSREGVSPLADVEKLVIEGRYGRADVALRRLEALIPGLAQSADAETLLLALYGRALLSHGPGSQTAIAACDVLERAAHERQHDVWVATACALRARFRVDAGDIGGATADLARADAAEQEGHDLSTDVGYRLLDGLAHVYAGLRLNDRADEVRERIEAGIGERRVLDRAQHWATWASELAARAMEPLAGGAQEPEHELMARAVTVAAKLDDLPQSEVPATLRRGARGVRALSAAYRGRPSEALRLLGQDAFGTVGDLPLVERQVVSLAAMRAHALVGSLATARSLDDAATTPPSTLPNLVLEVCRTRERLWLETYAGGEVVPVLQRMTELLVRLGWRGMDLIADTARQALEHQALRTESRTDALTGVGNRRALDEELRQLLRFGPLPLALILVDVDHFKEVNDQFTHVIGDEVLRRVAASLSLQLRTDDQLLRYGGDEFVVLLPGTGDEEANAVAERMASAVAARPWNELADGLRVTLTTGVAAVWSLSGRRPDADAEKLFRRADERLLHAKRDRPEGSSRRPSIPTLMVDDGTTPPAASSTPVPVANGVTRVRADRSPTPPEDAAPEEAEAAPERAATEAAPPEGAAAEPVADTPASGEAVADKPVADGPGADGPGADGPGAEEAATDEAVAAEAVVDEPSVESTEPDTIDVARLLSSGSAPAPTETGALAATSAPGWTPPTRSSRPPAAPSAQPAASAPPPPSARRAASAPPPPSARRAASAPPPPSAQPTAPPAPPVASVPPPPPAPSAAAPAEPPAAPVPSVTTGRRAAATPPDQERPTVAAAARPAAQPADSPPRHGRPRPEPAQPPAARTAGSPIEATEVDPGVERRTRRSRAAMRPGNTPERRLRTVFDPDPDIDLDGEFRTGRDRARSDGAGTDASTEPVAGRADEGRRPPSHGRSDVPDLDVPELREPALGARSRREARVAYRSEPPPRTSAGRNAAEMDAATREVARAETETRRADEARVKAEQAAAERERLQLERRRREQEDRERLARQAAEHRRQEQERLAQEAAEHERLEQERRRREQEERERVVRQEAERRRLDHERREQEAAERARLEQERVRREQQERERREREQAEHRRREQAERERREAEARAKAEAERRERERLERERREAEAKAEAERRERLAAQARAKAEAERRERERLERERRAAEARAKAEAEQRERLEAEARAAAKAEAERREQERRERERLEAEAKAEAEARAEARERREAEARARAELARAVQQRREAEVRAASRIREEAYARAAAQAKAAEESRAQERARARDRQPDPYTDDRPQRATQFTDTHVMQAYTEDPPEPAPPVEEHEPPKPRRDPFGPPTSRQAIIDLSSRKRPRHPYQG